MGVWVVFGGWLNGLRVEGLKVEQEEEEEEKKKKEKRERGESGVVGGEEMKGDEREREREKERERERERGRGRGRGKGIGTILEEESSEEF